MMNKSEKTGRAENTYPGRGLFITGTGTDVGKTYVTALILKKLLEDGQNPAYFKAAVSGNERGPLGLLPGDPAYVRDISGISQSLDTMCPYVYEAAVSPHLAARLEGNPAKLETIKHGFFSLCRSHSFVTMEGSGGILCPIRFSGPESSENLLLEDIVRELQLPCLIVADAGLGSINAAGLTAFYMKSRKIPVKGLIFNQFHPGSVLDEDNLRMCEAVTGLPVLACVKPGDTELDMDPSLLKSLYSQIPEEDHPLNPDSLHHL